MTHDQHFGLTLTRCDCCNRRTFCAVEGLATCESCCPAAVQVVREEALAAREEARVARQKARELLDEALPGDDVGPPVPYSQVAHLF